MPHTAAQARAKRRNPVKNARILESHYKYWHRNRHKDRAHKTVLYAVKTGKLIRRPCVLCGETRSQAHHNDYTKRLEVVWLCAKHHKQLHAGKLVFINKRDDARGAS